MIEKRQGQIPDEGFFMTKKLWYYIDDIKERENAKKTQL